MKILAADIGGTTTKMAICNETGELEQFREYDTESVKGGPYVIEKLITQLAEYEGYDAIGISTAGQVDIEQGSIRYANENIPNYTGMRVEQLVSDKLCKPVKIENDVNAAALGEMQFGAAKPYHDFLCLTFGTGIGGAIVLNRSIYRGANGSAAEFGHMFTHPLRDQQELGRLPYYERYASTTALVAEALKVNSSCNSGRNFFQMLKNGHAELEPVLVQWIEEVAAGLASLIHIFNPPAIIVGGGVMEQDELVKLVEAETKKLIMSSFANVAIKKASLGNKAGLLGAASLFIRQSC